MKTQITILVLLFTLNTIYVNAQINASKNNTIKNIKFNKKDKFKNLKLITGGNRGFVYQEDNLKKRLSNAEIIFKSEDGKRTHKVKTDKYGNYKILLKPGRYLVTVKHSGYKNYSTAPGYSVVNSKYGTFNIPLKRQTHNIVAVFNNKTKKIIDVVLLNKKNKRGLAKRKNTTLFYGKINGKINAKGTTLNINLEKQFVLGDQFLPGDMFIPGDLFIPGDQFVPGDQFKIHNTEFKVLKKSKTTLKIIVL